MLPGAGPERAVPFSISQRDKERLDFARRFFFVELSHRLEPPNIAKIRGVPIALQLRRRLKQARNPWRPLILSRGHPPVLPAALSPS